MVIIVRNRNFITNIRQISVLSQTAMLPPCRNYEGISDYRKYFFLLKIIINGIIIIISFINQISPLLVTVRGSIAVQKHNKNGTK